MYLQVVTAAISERLHPHPLWRKQVEAYNFHFTEALCHIGTLNYRMCVFNVSLSTCVLSDEHHAVAAAFFLIHPSNLQTTETYGPHHSWAPSPRRFCSPAHCGFFQLFEVVSTCSLEHNRTTSEASSRFWASLLFASGTFVFTNGSFFTAV